MNDIILFYGVNYFCLNVFMRLKFTINYKIELQFLKTLILIISIINLAPPIHTDLSPFEEVNTDSRSSCRPDAVLVLPPVRSNTIACITDIWLRYFVKSNYQQEKM